MKRVLTTNTKWKMLWPTIGEKKRTNRQRNAHAVCICTWKIETGTKTMEWENSKIIRIKIHYVLEAIAAFKVIFTFVCWLKHKHTMVQCMRDVANRKYPLNAHAWPMWANVFMAEKELSTRINVAASIDRSSFFCMSLHHLLGIVFTRLASFFLAQKKMLAYRN